MSYSTKRLAEIEAEQKLIDQQLADIEALDEPEGDEVARSKALEERSTETDDLIARFEALEVEKAPLIARANKLVAVREAAKDIARTESGDGSRYLGGSGPAFNKKIDPFDTDPRDRSLTKQDVISRAMTVIDREKRVPLSDSNKAHLEFLIHRSEADDEGQFDGSYIARRTLLTENPLYRSAFKKYMRLGPLAAYNADEQRAVSAFQEFEISRAAGEVTTTAGGFGVPVKLAA